MISKPPREFLQILDLYYLYSADEDYRLTDGRVQKYVKKTDDWESVGSAVAMYSEKKDLIFINDDDESEAGLYEFAIDGRASFAYLIPVEGDDSYAGFYRIRSK